MDWVIASSTNIERFRYDLQMLILEIEFKNGSTYQYFDVPLAVFEAFQSQVVSGGSAGKYFNAHIKGFFRYSKV